MQVTLGTHGGISVASLRGPQRGTPDARFELTAQTATIRLASGRTVNAMTFNGSSPGPELRVHQGDLVEVVLRNKDIGSGVTIHWHGVDVPNAEDGVAGVTQNAVLPGQSYTYRFRVHQAGTFWYHTHQVSSKEVRRGLFGAFVIEPRDPPPPSFLDLTLIAHTFDNVPTLNSSDELERRAVPPGTNVRLRLVNSDDNPQRFTLGRNTVSRARSRRHRPPRRLSPSRTRRSKSRPEVGPTSDSRCRGRPCVSHSSRPRSGSRSAPPARRRRRRRPPTRSSTRPTYGVPAPTPFGLSSHFDRRFDLSIGQKLGFFDGRPGRQWSLNGHIYPDVPIFVVKRGDLVQMTISNHTGRVHPMHLHGHHVLVLSKDGKPVTGSPWWPDTLEVRPHESYVVAFRADNPGIWMDHCHNLVHAAAGLTMHLAYEGVTTPFDVGDVTHNAPE